MDPSWITSVFSVPPWQFHDKATETQRHRDNKYTHQKPKNHALGYYSIAFGIAGTAFAPLIPSTLNVFLTFREAGKIIDEDFFYIAKTFIPGIVGSLVMVIVIYTWSYMSVSFSPYLRLAFSIILGLVVYMGFFWITKKEMFYEIRELVGRK